MGGDCAEDISANLKEELLQIENIQVCSPDTLLRLQKSLVLDKETHIGKSGSVNYFSKHPVLNALNLDMLLQSKTLQPNHLYDFDFDHQFIPFEKYDSKKGYKMKQGYFPGVASIGKNIVYIALYITVCILDNVLFWVILFDTDFETNTTPLLKFINLLFASRPKIKYEL